MPNWCECDLRITGPNSKIKELLAVLNSDKSDFDFNRLIPYPDHYQKLDDISDEWLKAHPLPWTPEVIAKKPEDGFSQGGYEWCVENWGTKWNVDKVDIDWEDDEEVLITFSTAWSAPIPIIKQLGKMLPELAVELRYFESGMGFNGLLRIEDGEVQDDR